MRSKRCFVHDAGAEAYWVLESIWQAMNSDLALDFSKVIWFFWDV